MATQGSIPAFTTVLADPFYRVNQVIIIIIIIITIIIFLTISLLNHSLRSQEQGK